MTETKYILYTLVRSQRSIKIGFGSKTRFGKVIWSMYESRLAPSHCFLIQSKSENALPSHFYKQTNPIHKAHLHGLIVSLCVSHIKG